MNERAIQEAMARSYIYRFLSAAFLHPDEALVAGLREDASKIKAISQTVLDTEGGSLEKLILAVASPQDFSPDALQSVYRQIFGHTISQECPPYETEYGSAHVFQQAQRLGDIAGFYEAFGLVVSDRAKDRLDHIAIELEFMSVLTHKEAYALTHHGEEKASICREAQRNFLEEHLGRWGPLFAVLLGRKAPGGFYPLLGSFLEAFIRTECRRVGAKPYSFHEGDVGYITQEPEGACFSCGPENFSVVDQREDT